MAKKHQQREHVSVRKKREEEQKLEKRRAFYAKHKKQLIWGAAALVAAVVVVCLSVDYFYTPGGSIRSFLGNLIGVEETDVVRNMGTAQSPLYFDFGSFAAPEGYTEDQANNPGITSTSDSKEQSHYYVAEDEKKAVHDVYVTGVKNKTGEQMLESVSTSTMYTFLGEKRSAEWAGHPVKYIYAQGNPNSEDTSIYYAVLIAYVDALQDSSILLNFSSSRATLEELPTEEAMAAEAEAILAGLQVNAAR